MLKDTQEGQTKYCEGCEEQCPVCGFYCVGKGGRACIDKPRHNCLLKNIQELEDEFIRDVTQIGSIPKSEVRKRLNKIISQKLEEQRKELVEKIKKDLENEVYINSDGIKIILKDTLYTVLKKYE